MEWIWTTQEQNRISVFRYMVRNRFTRLTDLMAEFQFSRYMVISIIEQLNEDIAVLTGETDILVIEKGNVIIFDAPLNVLPVDELKHYYLSQSTRAQIIMHLVAEDFDSWEELAFELDVSTPTVYKERAIVIEHLAEQDITLNKNNQLVGQEENIRFLRFALLTIYNGQRTEEISDRVKQVADYYIDSFITPEFGDLRESQCCIIWHMAAIWTVRFTQRHFVTATYTDQYLVPTSEMSPQSQRVIQAVKQLMGRSGLLSDEDLDNEARFIVLILHSLGVFATTQTHQDVTAHVIQWWQDFDASIQGSYQCIFYQPLHGTESRRLTYTVGDILMRFLMYPYGVGDGTYDMQHFNEFSNRYPLSTELGNEIVQRFADQRQISAEKLKTVLLTDLVAGIATTSTFFIDVPKVHVALDFGNHVNVERLLLDQFGAVTRTTIQISNRRTADTDILLTDVPRDSQGHEVVYIWRGIESRAYIDQLLDEINRIGMEKFNEWRRKQVNMSE